APPSSTHIVRTQDVYDSTHFTAQAVNYPILIRRLRWRCLPNTSGVAGMYNLVTVRMSTSPVDQGSLSTLFANNHGAAQTVVYSGPVNVMAAGAANHWYVDIWLTTPFRYDPSTAGDLTLDVTVDTTGWIGGAGPFTEIASTGCLASRITGEGHAA